MNEPRYRALSFPSLVERNGYHTLSGWLTLVVYAIDLRFEIKTSRMIS